MLNETKGILKISIFTIPEGCHGCRDGSAPKCGDYELEDDATSREPICGLLCAPSAYHF